MSCVMHEKTHDVYDPCHYQIRVQKLRPEAVVPTKAHPEDAGWDLCCTLSDDEQEKFISGMTQGSYREVSLSPGQQYMFSTGLAIGLPKGYYAQFQGRSGLATKGIVVLGGVIDESFRGEWKVILRNTSDQPVTITNTKAIAQFVLHKVPQFPLIEVEELEGTARGQNGFGSSDNKETK